MKKLLVTVFIICLASAAFAEDLKFQSNMTKSDFKDFAKEFGNVISFDPNSPADPLGITGFDISAESSFSYTKSNVWDKASKGGDADKVLMLYGVQVQKGLPGNIDISAMYKKAGNSNFSVAGAAVKYAILEGTAVSPAISLRGAYSQTINSDEVDAYNANVGLFISKGFVILKPYAGVVGSMTHVKEDSDRVNFSSETQYTAKGIVGLEATPFPFLKINTELGVGQLTQFALKFGIRF